MSDDSEDSELEELERATNGIRHSIVAGNQSKSRMGFASGIPGSIFGRVETGSGALRASWERDNDEIALIESFGKHSVSRGTPSTTHVSSSSASASVVAAATAALAPQEANKRVYSRDTLNKDMMQPNYSDEEDYDEEENSDNEYDIDDRVRERERERERRRDHDLSRSGSGDSYNSSSDDEDFSRSYDEDDDDGDGDDDVYDERRESASKRYARSSREMRAKDSGTDGGKEKETQIKAPRTTERKKVPMSAADVMALPKVPSSLSLAQQERKTWLLSPLPSSGRPLQCRLVRVRGGLGRLSPIYQLLLDGKGPVEDTSSTETKTFLMAARKKTKATPYILVSMEPEATDRASELVLGKLRGNTVGSQYSVVDGGVAPHKLHKMPASSSASPSVELRRELGVISLQYLDAGPCKIEAFIPIVQAGGAVVPTPATQSSDHPRSSTPSISETTFSPELRGGTGPGPGYVHTDRTTEMATAVSRGEFAGMYRLVNISPKWDDTYRGHVLNFRGRVTMASVKNFQLKLAGRYGNNTIANQCVEDSTVVLQFGRVGKDEFTMDVRWPLSPYQAFSICSAAIDGKIADRKGYAFVKKLGQSLKTYK